MAKNARVQAEMLEMLGNFNELGLSPKEILETARIFFEEHSKGPRDANLPNVRCTVAFRKETIRCAAKVDKNLSEYVTDAIENSNNRLKLKEMTE